MNIDRFYRWVVVISGFTETRVKQTGSEILWRKLRPFCSPNTTIQFREWDSDWEGMASFIDRNSFHDTRVLVAAYSWGAGHGFVKLAEALAKRNRYIDRAVLCDPVYRAPLLPLRWLALTRWPTIKLPHNVRAVDWLYQRKNRPWGHQPVLSTGFKPRGIELQVKHDEMDEHDEYHRRVIEHVANL